MKDWVKKLFSAFNSALSKKERTYYRTLEKTLGYHFEQLGLLVSALTHPSFYHENDKSLGEHNQRLEFLGDSVLSLILAEGLFEIYPNEREGVLAKARSSLAKGSFLTRLAKELEIPDYLRMSQHEIDSGGQQRASSLEDALEAIIGAIYLDSNYEKTRDVVLPWFGDLHNVLSGDLSDENPKGRLQELIQKETPKRSIQYNVVDSQGPDHEKEFIIEVLINGKSFGKGSGLSKKQAEEQAAREALNQLQKD